MSEPSGYCPHGYVRDHAEHPAAGLERCPTCDQLDAWVNKIGEAFLYVAPIHESVVRDAKHALRQLMGAAREAEKWYRESLDWQQAKSECDSEYEELDRAYRQACMNLATIRPDLSRDDFSLGDTADLYYDALLAGWGGIEGYDPGRKPKEPQ